MHTSFDRYTPTGPSWPLFSLASLRQLEQQASATLPPSALMQRAGLAVARLALAVAPHAQRIWIPCGPGNNGGDGLEAALHLLRWGKQPVVSLLYPQRVAPADADAARQRALAAGVPITDAPPPDWDLCIDALFGSGARTALDAACCEWIAAMQANAHAPVLAVDVPTGLDAQSGAAGPVFVHARWTLGLLATQPGLFTGSGRDACGEIWRHDLEVSHHQAPCAQTTTAAQNPPRPHASHKGNYGDVAIIGGAQGMAGAAVLAAQGALSGGAGRVFLGLLAPHGMALVADQPELMLRAPDTLLGTSGCIVAGCGGGDAIAQQLPGVLHQAARLVLDADALNCIATTPSLVGLLQARAPGTTVLTPHPLEAARLLGSSTQEVQTQRLTAAQTLAERFACTVLLKGSGSVIASPATLTQINATGNARLATGGTGDVLAGLVGAYLAGGYSAHAAACAAAYRHGRAADQWPHDQHLSASALARRL